MALKRIFMAAMLIITLPTVSVAETYPIFDPLTKSVVELNEKEVKDANTVSQYLYPLPGIEKLYQAYLSHGYKPYDAYFITLDEGFKIMKKLDPSFEVSPAIEKRANYSKSLYTQKE